MKAPQGGGHARDDGAELALEEFPPELERGENPKKALAQGDESRHQHHRVGREVMRLEVVEFKESSKESARREAEAAQAVRAEDHPLALFRCRRNLPRRRLTNPHEVLAQQAPRPAEELDMVLMDVGAIPRARQRHGRRQGARRRDGGVVHDPATAD